MNIEEQTKRTEFLESLIPYPTLSQEAINRTQGDTLGEVRYRSTLVGNININLSDNQISELISDERLNGLSIDDLITKYNISESLVYDLLSSKRITNALGEVKYWGNYVNTINLSDIQISELVSDKLNGSSMDDLITKYNLPRSFIYELLTTKGIINDIEMVEDYREYRYINAIEYIIDKYKTSKKELFRRAKFEFVNIKMMYCEALGCYSRIYSTALSLSLKANSTNPNPLVLCDDHYEKKQYIPREITEWMGGHYNYPYRNQYNFRHQQEGMKRVRGNCAEDDCEEDARYNKEGFKRAFCETHKLDDMVYFEPKCFHGYTKRFQCYICSPKSKYFCDSCHITTASKKYRNHCVRCFVHLFPGEKTANNYKTKELLVADFIKKYFDREEVISDKRVSGGCSKKRPDLLIDKLTHSVIIEIDENQHGSVDYSCENKRVMEIFQDLGSRPIVIIRFNPDSYSYKGKKFPSCFRVCKTTGLCIVDNKKEWKRRLEELRDTVEINLNVPRDPKEVNIISLFFNK